MIPKKIHYCWFGYNPKPPLAEKCIKSWKRHCPDYEIVEWNEDNFDIASCPLYVRQAYQLKKWAFVTDYIRLKVVYDNGGIYLDTDVELKKRLDELLKYKAFFGFETTGYINTGLGFGAEEGMSILSELMSDYEEILFQLPDGKIDDLSCPKRNAHIFTKHGMTCDNKFQILDGDIAILPSEYLCPLDFELNKMKYTKNTISVHWFSASWFSKEQKKRHHQRVRRERRARRIDCIAHIPNRTLMKLLGNDRYQRLKSFIKKEE